MKRKDGKGNYHANRCCEKWEKGEGLHLWFEVKHVNSIKIKPEDEKEELGSK